MNRVLSMLVALAFLGLPAGAVAQSAQTNAPPGNSAIDEYLETVPGVGGNQQTKPPSGGGSSGSAGSGGSTSPALTPAQRADLERLGTDGEALADVVDQTSPGTPAQQPRVEPVPEGKGRSPLVEAVEVATGSGGGGMGALLPAILLAALLATIALVVLRRRSAS